MFGLKFGTELASALAVGLCLTFTSTASANAFEIAAPYRAAEILLQNVVDQVTAFKYPGVNTSDLPELIAPYKSQLKELGDTLLREGKLSEKQLAELSFLCAPGILNIKELIMRESRPLLFPQKPGDTADSLKKTHADALNFFSEKAALVGIISDILGCTK
jgi:hypothetical protein